MNSLNNITEINKYNKILTKRWGTEKWVKVTDKYAVKILFVDAGKSLSLQYHKNKEETWVCVEGNGYVIDGNGKKIKLSVGDTVHLPPYTIHKLVAIKKMSVVECSTTELDDVIRLDNKESRD